MLVLLVICIVTIIKIYYYIKDIIMATTIVRDVGESKIFQYALLGAGGFLIYEFWDEIKALFKTGEEVTKGVGEAIEDLDIPGALDTIGDVTEDLFSGDWDATLGDFEKASGVLKPISLATKALEKWGGIRQPDYAKTPWKSKDEPCHPSNIPNYNTLEEYNDWRPSFCQTQIANAILTGYGNLGECFNAHQNHLINGVRDGKGGIVRMMMEVNEFTQFAHYISVYILVNGRTCPIENYSNEYGRLYFPIGIAYFLAKEKGTEYTGGPTQFTPDEREDYAKTLNSISLAPNYFTGDPVYWQRERAFAESLGLKYAFDPSGQSIVFTAV
jgi:hypothetical protein